MLGPRSGLLTWVGGAIPLFRMFGAAKPVTPLREAASQREEALLAGGAELNTPALLAEGWPKVAAALWEEPEVALPGEEPALLEEAPEERPATPDHTADNTVGAGYCFVLHFAVMTALHKTVRPRPPARRGAHRRPTMPPSRTATPWRANWTRSSRL